MGFGACLPGKAANWPENINVAVNISALQLQNPLLPAIVTAALGKSGLAPSRLELEITESAIMPVDAASLKALHMIRDTGVRIVIDDFDVGYSSLGYLVSFPFDKIKVDRFFTSKLTSVKASRNPAQAIIQASIGLCKDLDITLLVEGVETPEQLMVLQDVHCTEIFKVIVPPPQPASAIPGILANAPALLREMTGNGATKAKAAQALWSESVLFFSDRRGAERHRHRHHAGSGAAGSGDRLCEFGFHTAERLHFCRSHRAVTANPARPRHRPRHLGQNIHRAACLPPVHEKVLNYAKSGAPYWLDLQIVPLRDAAGQITHFAAIERDVTLDKRRLDELEYLADRDTLTGIPNRRAFLRAVNSEINAAAHVAVPAADAKGPCLIFMDVDHFKKVNDELGHPIGDAVLCGMADCLAENVRRVDIVGRIGGEEFAVCMPGVNLEGAKSLADRLRSAVARAQLATAAGPVRITVSVGISCFKPGDSIETLTARADAAMYAAKRAGGDRVRASSLS